MFVSVAPLVFRAPEGPAAREARRAHFVRRRASKPARALRSLRRPPHRRCLWFWCARPGPAAHGRRSHALRCLRRPPHRRRRIADVWLGASARSPARPRRPRAPQLTLTNFARNSPATISNLECASLELQRFQRLLKVLVIELRATFQGLSPMQASGHRPQETATGLVLWATGLGSLAQSGSGERNIAPAWCSSSCHDASLKQKPPTRAQNCRKVVSLSVPGRIIFHGPLQQLTHGRIFFHPGPVYGHRIHQQSSDWGAGRSAAVCRASPADEGRCHVGGVEVGAGCRASKEAAWAREILMLGLFDPHA